MIPLAESSPEPLIKPRAGTVLNKTFHPPSISVHKSSDYTTAVAGGRYDSKTRPCLPRSAVRQGWIQEAVSRSIETSHERDALLKRLSLTSAVPKRRKVPQKQKICVDHQMPLCRLSLKLQTRKRVILSKIVAEKPETPQVTIFDSHTRFSTVKAVINHRKDIIFGEWQPQRNLKEWAVRKQKRPSSHMSFI